jgi:hypothetical protein
MEDFDFDFTDPLNSIKRVFKKELLNEIDVLKKDSPKVAEDAELCLPHITCIFCLDTGRFIRDRESDFAWLDFRGEFDLMTCSLCSRKQATWIKCLHDKNHHENGRRVFHESQRNGSTTAVELARIYNSEYKNRGPVITNDIKIEGPKININNNC